MAKQTRAQQRAAQIKKAEEKRLQQERQRRTRMIVGGVVAVVLFALLAAVYLPGSTNEATADDTTAGAWDLPALDGDGRVAIGDFRGKPTVVAFYASWCEVCEQEMPGLLALSEQIRDEVNFVAVNAQDNGQGLADAEKWGIAGKWPIAVDVGGTNGSDLSMGTFGMRGMPLNLIYDATGTLVYTHPGGLGTQDALTLLDQLTEFDA